MPSPVTYARKTFGSPSFESYGHRLSLFLDSFPDDSDNNDVTLNTSNDVINSSLEAPRPEVRDPAGQLSRNPGQSASSVQKAERNGLRHGNVESGWKPRRESDWSGVNLTAVTSPDIPEIDLNDTLELGTVGEIPGLARKKKRVAGNEKKAGKRPKDLTAVRKEGKRTREEPENHVAKKARGELNQSERANGMLSTTEEENSTQEDDFFESPQVKVQTKYQRKKRPSLERSDEKSLEIRRFSLFKESTSEKKTPDSKGKHQHQSSQRSHGLPTLDESPSVLRQQKLYFEEVDKGDLVEATEEEIHNTELSQQVPVLPGKKSVAYKRYMEYVEGMKDVAAPFTFEEFLSGNKDLDFLFS